MGKLLKVSGPLGEQVKRDGRDLETKARKSSSPASSSRSSSKDFPTHWLGLPGSAVLGLRRNPEMPYLGKLEFSLLVTEFFGLERVSARVPKHIVAIHPDDLGYGCYPHYVAIVGSRSERFYALRWIWGVHERVELAKLGRVVKDPQGNEAIWFISLRSLHVGRKPRLKMRLKLERGEVPPGVTGLLMRAPENHDPIYVPVGESIWGPDRMWFAFWLVDGSAEAICRVFGP